MNDDRLVGICAIYIVMLFLGPAIFMWIWNWQLGDIYVFTYWQVFWLGIALSFLRAGRTVTI